MPEPAKPCRCQSHGCRGVPRHRKTWEKHAREDAVLATERVPKVSATGVNLAYGCPYYPTLYRSHKAARTPLYENAEISQLDHIYIELRKFVAHPFHTKDAVTNSFQCDKKLKLPKPNTSCESFEEARRVINDFLIPLQTFHCCPNDCIVFRGPFEDAKECPKCNTARYDRDGRPKKVYKYMPIGPRIARLFQDENLVKIIQTHCTRNEDGVIRDLWDTERWKGWFSENGEFGGDRNGICLSFCSDGVNPFKSMHVVYSMWPLMISVVNFPVAIRKSFGGILLLGIVPGNGRHEPDVDPYIEIAVDELLTLAECHLYYSGYFDGPMSIKVKLLQYVLDFPALAKILHLPASGAIVACPWCEIRGVYSKSFHKTIYLDNRRYLPCDHCLRRSASYREQEEKEPLQAKNDHDRTTKLREKYGTLKNENQRKKFTKEYGVKGNYPIMKLPYQKYGDHIQPDGMHTLSDVLINIIELAVAGISSEKLLSAEEDVPFIRSNEDRSILLSKEEKEVGNNRCQLLNFPKTRSGFKGKVFDKPKKTLQNTHGWTEYASLGIWTYLMRDALPTRTRRTLLYFFRIVRRMYRRSFTNDDLTNLISETQVALSLMERDFPIWIQNITTHIMRHIPEKMRENGPLYATWMFPYERLNSWMSRRALNRYRTEECIMATYQINDWVLFSQMCGYFKNLRLYDDNISKITNRALNREGVLDETMGATLKQTRYTLSERQQSDLAIDGHQSFTSCFSAKQIDYVSKIADDATFHLGDACYIKSRNMFGIIRELLVLNKIQYADIQLFSPHDFDAESAVAFSDKTPTNTMTIAKICDVSEPLVTAVEGDVIWFVSHCGGNDNFVWFDDHVRL